MGFQNLDKVKAYLSTGTYAGLETDDNMAYWQDSGGTHHWEYRFCGPWVTKTVGSGTYTIVNKAYRNGQDTPFDDDSETWTP